MTFRTLPTPGAPYGTTSVETIPSWRTRAACLDTDPELFFPISEPDSRIASAVQAYQEAKSFCREKCPVTAECLEDSLESEGSRTFGVRGATDPDERRAILRQRSRARAATEKRTA